MGSKSVGCIPARCRDRCSFQGANKVTPLSPMPTLAASKAAGAPLKRYTFQSAPMVRVDNG